MTITALSLAIGTALSATGGTATPVISRGNTIGLHNVVLDDGSAFKDLTTMKFSSKDGTVSPSAPGGYTQARNSIVISRPKTLANLNTTKNTVRIDFSVDPETTAAEIDALRELAAQVMFSTSLDEFYHDKGVV
jgi:hypothetical protein